MFSDNSFSDYITSFSQTVTKGKDFYTVITDDFLEAAPVHLSQSFEGAPKLLTVFINITEGKFLTGLACYNLLQKVRQAEINTVNIGMTAGPGLPLFLAGKHRLCFPHTFFRLISSVDVDDDCYDDLHDCLFTLLAESTTRSVREWKAIALKKTLISAEEAVELGLAHKIIRGVS